MLRPLISLAPVFAALAAPALAQTSPPPDPSNTLPKITITGTARATQPAALREDIVTTESINAKEMARSGATNLPELMKARPGVDVQVECSV
jgi:outer membrane cobalamin receptor